MFFFSQGTGRIGNNVHHRNVFASILEFEVESPEFKSYAKVLEVIAYLYPIKPPQIYEAAERVFGSDLKGLDLGRRFVDDVVKCGAWDEAFIPLLELSERLENLSTLVKQRSNRELETDSMFGWIFTAQGYQFSARRLAASLLIESAQMDSPLILLCHVIISELFLSLQAARASWQRAGESSREAPSDGGDGVRDVAFRPDGRRRAAESLGGAQVPRSARG